MKFIKLFIVGLTLFPVIKVSATKSCRGGVVDCLVIPPSPARKAISTKPNQKLDWSLLNLKKETISSSIVTASIEITQSDASLLASDGNSWVVFGGANNTMTMNIGVANSESSQTWALPDDFQNYFDYYTQDDFIAPSKVPVALQIAGATHITKSTYVDENDSEFEVYEHFNINANSINHLGKSYDFDIDDDAFDEPDYEFMDIPLNLGDVINSTIDEYDYETDQQLYRTITTLTIDAYGTITIPNYGTYNCLRGFYQSQFYARPNESSAFVLQKTFNSIGFMTKQGHFFQAKIVSQTGSNAILENLSFKAIVPTASLSELTDVKLNNDGRGVTINTFNAEAHPSAILDIDNDKLGILIPRITEENRPSNPATGLLIYQINTNPGFYYFDGNNWQRLDNTTAYGMNNKTRTSAKKISTSFTKENQNYRGKGELKNGSTFIKFDQIQENFDDLMINIQLEGDCNGVYISKKTREGFEVKELQKGKSSVRFTWNIQ